MDEEMELAVENAEEEDFTEGEFAEPQEGAAGEQAEEEGAADPQPTAERKPQTSEKNAYFQKLRHKEEQQRAYERGKTEALIGMKNSYTGEEIKDVQDAQEFIQMYEAEKKGLDPVSDLGKFRKEQARESGKLQQEMGQVEEQSGKDVQSFAEEHPDIDISKLLADEAFLDYATGKLGEKPLGEIYDKYVKLTGGYEQRAARQARQMVAKSLATPGALSGGGSAEPVTYENMSDEAFEKALEKAKRGELTKYKS